MSVNQQGFSLVEVLIAMAIGSVLLLATARFLPALQMMAIKQTQRQALNEEIWQRVFTISRQIQRAGFCRGNCVREGLVLGSQCLLSRWDSNLNGKWEDTPASTAEVTGIRLHNGAIETLRGATNCAGKGWEKMTDPEFMLIDDFSVTRHDSSGFSPEFTVTLKGHLTSRPDTQASASFSVTGHNL